MLRQHENIFQIKARPREEGREIMKEEGEADRDSVFTREEHFGARMRAKQVGVHLRGRCGDFVCELFVFRERLNEIENERNVVRCRRPDGKRGHGGAKRCVKRAPLSSSGAPWCPPASAACAQPITCRVRICVDDTRLR